jgi:malonate transporter and related proteins
LQAIAIASVPLALVIITVNLFCISILARHGHRPPGAATPSMWRSIATNPLIIACALGLAVNPLGIDWPRPVDTVFSWFGTAAIALGLFAVGAGLTGLSGKGSLFAILSSNAINLLVKPALFLTLALVLGLPEQLVAIGLVCTVAPTATSSYILARQLGGNAPLMAQIVTVGTLLSMLTVSGWFLLWAAFF